MCVALGVQAQTPINWIKKNGPVGGAIFDLEIDPASGKVFLLDGNNRPYVSTDNGETWQKIVLPDYERSFEDIEITNGTIFLVGSYELWASTDGGVTFQERMTDVSPYEGGSRLKRMPVSGKLVVLSYNGIYTSSNNGQTWTLQGSLSGVDQGDHLAVNAVDQIYILKQNASFELRPFRSTNGGVSFSEVSTGIPVGHHVNTLAIDRSSANLYCVTNEDIFISTDGVSWATIKNGSITDVNINDVFPFNSQIAFSADNLGIFFIDNTNHKLHAKGINEATWALRAPDFPSPTLIASCVTAKDYPTANSATAFFGTPSGVFKTITGGASVAENNVGLAGVKGEQMLSDNYGYLYLRTKLPTTNSDELIKSQDNGNTWTKVTGLGTPISYFTQTREALFALVLNTPYRSYNNGTNWFALSFPTAGFNWIGGVGDSKLFALEYTSNPLSLYYSANNGETWTISALTVSGMPASFSLDESTVVFASENQMFFRLYDYSAFASSYYRIDFTYDASDVITSATATQITTLPIPMDDVYKMSAANGKIFVYQTYGVSADRIAVSSDGGVSWATHSVPASDDFFAVQNGYLFLTDNSSTDKIYISRDDGATFVETSVPTDFNTYYIEDIALDNSGFAYLAMNGDYVYQSAATVVLPAAPSDLTVNAKTSATVALDWLDPNDYDRDIIIERSTNGVDFTVAGQVSGWDVCYYPTENRGYFVDVNLSPNTTYTYRVKARNAAGDSPVSSTVMVTTLADCAQDVPENRSWSAINSGTEGYALLGAPVTVGVKHLGNGKYEISDLTLGLTGSSEVGIFYQGCGQTLIQGDGGLNPNGNGTWDGATLTLKWRSCYYDKTETISLTLNATDPAPAKPASLLGYVISNTAIELKWKGAYYEKSYVLERSLSPSSGFVSIATVDYPALSYLDEDPTLTLGTTYYYRIKALNGNVTPDESPYSDVVTVPFNKPNFIVANNAITDFNASATLSSIWADFNHDGLEDYMTMQYDAENEQAVPTIFKNLGTGDYEKIVVDVGSTPYTWPSVADYDNDHYPDLALSGDDARVLDIFKGNGDFTFTKVPAGQLGDLAVIEKIISTSSWADVNNDGLPDLMLLNSEDGSYTLFRQNANHSFTKILQGPPTQDESLVAVWADYDNDGFQDVFITNLDGAAGLHRNNGDETFTKVTGNGIDATNLFAAAWGDYNNDGFLDLFCGSVAENALYKNNGDGTFTKDVSTVISEANFTLSAAWGDYNNDGFLDLMTVCLPFNASAPRLFIRDPSVTASVAFKKITTEKIADASVAHYSVATADPDQNGQLDIAMSAFLFDDSNDGVLPTNNNFYQNNNTLANWVEVKLNPSTGGTEALGARITLTAGGKTQTREVASVSSLVSRNSTIAHFGLGTTSTITNIQIRWPHGGVQNYPLPPINQVLVIDEDVTGPVITTKTPEHNATAVVTTTTLTLQFNEEPFGVSGKTIAITKIGEGTPFTTVNANAGSKTGNQITYTLPLELEGETQYRVTIEAGAFRDRWLNPSLAVGPLEWWFTTDAAIDAEAPAITPFVPPGSLAKGFGTISPNITVTDNVGVNTVVVSIRKISGSGYTQVNATATGTANTYSATLSEGTHFDATGAEFFITATDAAGNTSRDPANPDNTHKVYLTYDETQSAIPSSALGFGGTKQSWKVFSIPFELVNPNNSVNNIFNEFTALTPKTDYRLITINDARNGWKESPAFTDIARGQGYFINIKNVTTIKLYNDLKAPTNSRANLYQMNLAAGWNMIGNPYLTPISWDDVAVLNGLSGTEAQLKTYSGGTYNNDQDLAPFEGGFVLMTAAKTISIPFQGQTSSGGRKGVPSLGDDISAEAWALPLTLRQDDLTYTLGGVGMAPDADESIDNYDDVTPPRFIDFLELNFDHPEHIAKRFTREIVPTQQNYTWDFTIDSNLEGMAELSWNNAPLMTSGKDIFLLDVKGQTLVNMKESGSLRFDPKSSRQFRIYYGDNLRISPDRVQLGRAYPNPASGLTTIAFSLPETGGLNQSVSLDIVDAMGHVVGVVQQGRFDPGFHAASVDVSELTKGFYTYRLSVQNRNGRTTEVNKLIIK